MHPVGARGHRRSAIRQQALRSRRLIPAAERAKFCATAVNAAQPAWDFRPGSNFVLEIQQAAAQAERTIAVFSPDFLASRFTAPEWAAAFARDPTGALGLLLPVRVRECEPTGLLPQITYIDLLGLEDRNAACDRLLAGVKRDRANHLFWSLRC